MTVPPKITADAWANAVFRGETMLGYDDWKKEQLQAPAEPEEEGPELRSFNLRLGVTCRDFFEWTVAAESEEKAIEELQSKGIPAFVLRMFENGLEGDEIVYVSPEDDHSAEEIEVDMRTDGEPFSWDACAIVKDLAKLHGLPMDPECLTQVEALINRAKAACTKGA